MIRIEYQVPTANNGWHNMVVFADTYDEAEEICRLCEQYYYRIVDVSNYVEEN